MLKRSSRTVVSRLQSSHPLWKDFSLEISSGFVLTNVETLSQAVVSHMPTVSPISAWKTRFCYHKHNRKMSRRLNKNIQWFHAHKNTILKSGLLHAIAVLKYPVVSFYKCKYLILSSQTQLSIKISIGFSATNCKNAAWTSGLLVVSASCDPNVNMVH